MSISALLIRRWQNEGVVLNSGATAAELGLLEEILGIELPEDLRGFYAAVNGMPESTHDEHMVEFWSIERIARELAESDDVEIGFADVLISSWRFIFQPSATGLVVVSENVHPSSPKQVLGTFSQFLDTYLRSPQQLGLP